MGPLASEMMDLLARNGAAMREDPWADPQPVARLFMPDGDMVWLVAAVDPDHEDLAYGLVDVGDGRPETGSFSLSEVMAVRGRLGLAVERDVGFRSDGTLARYACRAALLGRVAT